MGCPWETAVACHRWGSGPSAPGGDGARADPMWQRCPGPGPQGRGFGSTVKSRVDLRCGRECSEGQDGGCIRSQWPQPHLCWAEETHGGRRGEQNWGALMGWPLSPRPRRQLRLGGPGEAPTSPCPGGRGSIQHPPLCSRGTLPSQTSIHSRPPPASQRRRAGSAARGGRAGGGAARGRRAGLPGGGTGRRPALIHCNKLFPSRRGWVIAARAGAGAAAEPPPEPPKKRG